MVISALYYLIQFTSIAIGFTHDRFEDTTIWLRMALPLLGFLLIIIFVHVFRVDGRDVGVTHTLNRLANYEGEFPWRNAAMQFIAAATALIAGFSGGRDGPGLHLGAWVASNFRRRLRLTRAEADVLIRAGMTAAIAAGFHTTLAAVCFVAEIIKTEPTSVRSLIPLFVAAAVASAISAWFGVDQYAIGAQMFGFLSIGEWLCVIGLAVPVLIVGVSTVQLTIEFTRIRGPLYARIMVIALVTAGLALVFPSVLGLGYDTFMAAERGELDLGLLYLLAFIVIKVLLTSTSVAFGVPLGVIGPTLVNGGVLGALCYTVLNLWFPELVSAPISFYVLLGATALIGTVFNAPLTATVLFFELTLNLGVTLQVAATIVIAHACKINLWGTQSIFEARLAAQGIKIRNRTERL